MKTTLTKKYEKKKIALTTMNPVPSDILCLSMRHLWFIEKLVHSLMRLPAERATLNLPATRTHPAPTIPSK